MNVGTAALAASLNLKTADLLRVLSSNAATMSTNNNSDGLLCEANKQALNDPFHHSPQSNRKRRNDDRSPNSAHSSRHEEEHLNEMEDVDEEEYESGDNLSDLTLEIPHKQAHLLNNNCEEGENAWCKEGQKNGFRGELKRPDLKGSFRCTICQKVFCHSSSLSRHRMQAHFKSYTCTLCSKEITSNETLRAHMLKQHQISRMFMCRCCNWAFPDKTSLHMHMQLQGKHDQSTDNISSKVPVIGKSNPLPSNQSDQPNQSQKPTDHAQNSLFNSPNLLANPGKFPPQFFGPAGFPHNLLNGVHPMSAALLAAAAASASANGQGQGQQGGLFPGGVPAEALLNIQQHLNTQSPIDQKQPNGLFPQLSMMRNDNIDLLSKLRQRLFLTNMWTQQKMPKMPFNTVNNGNEKHLLEQFIENNNQLDVGTLSRNSNERRSVDEEGMEESEGRRSGEEIVTQPSPTPTANTQSKTNLAQLMQLLHKNALQNSNQHVNENNNDSTKNQNIEEADSNNNNNPISAEHVKVDGDEEEGGYMESLKSNEDETEEDDGNRLNFVQGPLTPNSSLNTHNSHELSEQNAHLKQKLQEFRQQLLEFMQQSTQLDDAHAQFLHNLLKLTQY